MKAYHNQRCFPRFKIRNAGKAIHYSISTSLNSDLKDIQIVDGIKRWKAFLAVRMVRASRSTLLDVHLEWRLSDTC